MLANDGVECRRLLTDDGVPVSIDEVIERRDLFVHVRGWQSVQSGQLHTLTWRSGSARCQEPFCACCWIPTVAP
jgi:hypothetical protein